jgi:hypothetical protein
VLTELIVPVRPKPPAAIAQTWIGRLVRNAFRRRPWVVISDALDGWRSEQPLPLGAWRKDISRLIVAMAEG